MAEVPTREEMAGVLRESIEKAVAELGIDEVVKLSGVMKALCLQLNDTGSCYYVRFNADGTADFSVEDPELVPVLTISTTSETFHDMCTGRMDPAKAFAFRKVKISGVPLMSLGRIGGNLLDALFRSYTEVVDG